MHCLPQPGDHNAAKPISCSVSSPFSCTSLSAASSASSLNKEHECRCQTKFGCTRIVSPKAVKPRHSFKRLSSACTLCQHISRKDSALAVQELNLLSNCQSLPNVLVASTKAATEACALAFPNPSLPGGLYKHVLCKRLYKKSIICKPGTASAASPSSASTRDVPARATAHCIAVT